VKSPDFSRYECRATLTIILYLQGCHPKKTP
jgi:hypothetical protein